MRHLLAALFLALNALSPASPAWKLAWADEFNLPAGAPPDAAKWTLEFKGDGFGNNELEFYTRRPENCRHDGKGNLVLEARKERFQNRGFSSARLHTSGHFSQRYGRIEARLQLPAGGKGIWPAFWMLGDNLGPKGWPACGEIDIMEWLGSAKNEIHGSLHGPGYSGANPVHGEARIEPAGFHVYAVEWEPGQIRWYVDQKLYETRGPADLRGKAWVYDHPFFIILNLAVGGAWPGAPDASTPFPQQMLVDYVRVYTDTALKADESVKAVEAPKAEAFSGPTLQKIPGRVLASHFMNGGEGKAYHDSDAENQGGEYRRAEGVDLQACQDEGGGFNVGWVKKGEWIAYELEAEKAGTYALSARVASESAGGRARLILDGHLLGRDLVIPSTGGWQNWASLDAGTAQVSQGRHILQLQITGEGPSGSAGNFNWIQFKLAE